MLAAPTAQTNTPGPALAVARSEQHLLQLTSRARDDASAFEELYRLTREDSAALLSLLVERRALETCLVEVYRRLLDALPSHPAGEAVRGLLQRLCVQVALEHPRLPVEPVPDDDAGRLRRALRKLTPKLRPLFVLREVFGLTPEEIARVTGVALPTLRSRLRRARLEVTEAMREQFSEAP